MGSSSAGIEVGADQALHFGQREGEGQARAGHACLEPRGEEERAGPGEGRLRVEDVGEREEALAVASGFVLLLLAYVGSRFALEVVLGRN